MYTVTSVTPTGKQRTTNVSKIREAGQMVAFTLYDNFGLSRADATELAMQAERTGTVEFNGVVFTITKGVRS